MINKVAFVFPGQGSQSLGLLNSFVLHHPIVYSIFEQAANTIGYDLWKIAQQDPLEQLNQTIYTQPILLTASFALWELWKAEGGLMPDYLLGNSLGEYTAYVSAKSIEWMEALQLVAQRGLYMQMATDQTKSAMAVIVGLPNDEVLNLCRIQQLHEIVSPSNYNTEDQTVISGHQQAVLRVMQSARQRGARIVKQLPISVPAHCALMEPAIVPLNKALNQTTFNLPVIPVISNLYNKPLSDVKSIKRALLHQLVEPVDWVKQIHYLLRQGVNCFIECGPNRVLSSFIRHIAPDATVFSLGNYHSFHHALHQCKQLKNSNSRRNASAIKVSGELIE